MALDTKKDTATQNNNVQLNFLFPSSPFAVATDAKQGIVSILNAINDIDKLLDSLTEDLRSSMVNDGFDPDDYKYWNACLVHSPYNLEGLLETFEGALETLELYILETVKGYKILTQLAYDKNPRLPGLNKQEGKG